MDTVKTRMITKTDEELLEIVEQKYKDYTSQALDYAIEELKRRNIPFVDPSVKENGRLEEAVENAVQEELLYCTQCKAAMKPGNIYIGAAMGGVILPKLTFKHCYFQPSESGKKEFKVIDNSELKKAYYCKSCGLITFKIRG